MGVITGTPLPMEGTETGRFYPMVNGFHCEASKLLGPLFSLFCVEINPIYENVTVVQEFFFLFFFF